MAKESLTPEEIQKKFDSLPADIKAAVYGVDMLNIIQKLGEKYKLHIDQVGTLEAETADVMIGFSKPEEFVGNLSEALIVDRAQAENIAKEINEQVFIKIRESLKNLHTQQVPSIVPKVVPAPTTTKTIPAPASTPAVAAPKPDLVAAEAMLQAKTVSAPAPAVPAQPVVPQKTVPTAAPVMPPIAKQEPPKPGAYAADPYREPPL